MKHFKYLTRLAVFAVILFASCDYKDKGMTELVKLPDIVIDTTGIPLQHNVLIGDPLQINPIVTKGDEAISSFKYEWWLTSLPGSDFARKEIISTEKNLNVEIHSLADVDYYSLWFRATDTLTGLVKGVVFRVVVEGPSNQGLVVADSDDGINSDFSLVQDSLFTSNWVERGTTTIKNTVYKRNQLFTASGRKFNGIVHSLFSQRLYFDNLYKYLLHGASQHNAFRINTLDFSMVAEGRELFYDEVINLDISRYFLNGASQAWIINQGRVHSRLSEAKTATAIRKFSNSVAGTYNANKFIAVHPITGQNAIIYDEVLGQFRYFGTSLALTAAPQTGSGTTPFNPASLPGYTVLGSGLGNLSEVRFVMKKDEYYGIFTLTATAAPSRLLNISDAPDIENAVGFVFPIDQSVIYYATSTKVYSIRIPAGTTTPAYTELYTSPEPITMFEMLRQSGFKSVPLTERCLLVITYNGTEGKVTALPIPAEGLNLGIIDATRKATFGGFKKISAVAVQE